ncbi:hypothetical protein HWV62_18842 [Athelia sp. TMB]|nr:hypothetical protein HWV62_18842 [Athelia sp. TMB]
MIALQRLTSSATSFISGTPPAKRRRIDYLAAAPSNGVPIRCRPWFEDGNIVLETEGKQFKVYKGILAANSPIFKDLFALAQPSGNEEVDGCPLVQLSDSALDLGWVLEALHDSERRKNTSGKSMTYSVLIAFLRLGRKYEIQHIRDQALEKLELEFPTTWRGYLARITAHRESTTATGYIAPREILAMVDILRENDLAGFLPAALYRCFIDDQKGRVSIFQESLVGPAQPRPILRVEDIKACSRAYKKLIRLQAAECFAWLRSQDRYCYYSASCYREKSLIEGKIFFPVPLCVPLGEWDATWVSSLCSVCAASGQAAFLKGSKEIWEQLPALFGLPNWEDDDFTFSYFFTSSNSS